MLKNKYIGLFGILLLAGLIMMSGCGAKTAEKGSVVQVDYTGKLTDGTVFDSSIGKQPLEFTVGSGQMIAGFDKAVLGMKVGQSKTVTITAADAYGTHRDDMVRVINKSDLPEGVILAVGRELQMRRGDGSAISVPITAVSDTTITVDANHPLAGKDLIFEIKLISIK